MTRTAVLRSRLIAVLVCVATGCASCAVPQAGVPRQSPAPQQSATIVQQSPAATESGDCGRLGELAPVCGKTFVATRIDGGDPGWATLPALRLRLAATPRDEPYLSVDTGANTTMTPLEIRSDHLIPTGTTAMTLVGFADGADPEAARQQWVLDFTAGAIQWKLSEDHSQLTLSRGGGVIVARFGQ